MLYGYSIVLLTIITTVASSEYNCNKDAVLHVSRMREYMENFIIGNITSSSP